MNGIKGYYKNCRDKRESHYFLLSDQFANRVTRIKLKTKFYYGISLPMIKYLTLNT